MFCRVQHDDDASCEGHDQSASPRRRLPLPWPLDPYRMPYSSSFRRELRTRAAYRVRLTRIDGSVRRAPSPYRLGLSQLSWRTVDVREKAVSFRQMTGVNGVDGRHGRVHGFWHEISCTKAVMAFQPPRTPWTMGHLALNTSSFINHSQIFQFPDGLIFFCI